MFDLTGKTAIIAGGAGGIGTALSLGLAESGADVMVADLNTDNFTETANRIRGMGRQAHVVKTDITNEQSVEEMVKHALKVFLN